MIKLQDIMENFGGPGKVVLPPDHKAGLRVPKGGSCCANCKYWEYNDGEDRAFCSNTYYQKWSKTDTIPYPANEYCTDWWEPKPKKNIEKDLES